VCESHITNAFMNKQLQNKLYYQANKEKIKKRVKEWAENNVEKTRVYKERYRKQNPEKLKFAYKKYSNSDKGKKTKKDYMERMRIECPERKRAIVKKYDKSEKGKVNRKKWLLKNQERIRKCYRDYMKTLKGRESHKIHTHKRRAIIKSLTEHFTLSEWEALKEQWDYTCLSCKKKISEIKLSPDHIIPLSKGGKNTIDNIQVLCLKCNLKKNNKIIDYRLLVN